MFIQTLMEFLHKTQYHLFNLSPNQYLIYVRDSRGCVDRDTVLITQPDSIYIDTTIFTYYL